MVPLVILQLLTSSMQDYNTMNSIFISHNKKRMSSPRGFVLPFTMFIVSVMLLISTSVSVMLIKQLYFSRITRQSQAAYYAADNAVACTILIEDTYRDNSSGVFPEDPGIDRNTYMATKLDSVNAQRLSDGLTALASWDDVVCAQSTLFKTDDPNSFEISVTPFTRDLSGGGTEDGVTSSFNMKMDLGDGTYRCSKVTVNKTPTYRQIIAQGYALCNRPDGSVERAVINTTVSE
jgi:hypothetical protein